MPAIRIIVGHEFGEVLPILAFNRLEEFVIVTADLPGRLPMPQQDNRESHQYNCTI